MKITETYLTKYHPVVQLSVDIIWDPVKAHINFKKHGVSFEEAATVIQSAMTVTIEDTSTDEQRFATIGVSLKLRWLMVVHTYRDDSEIRIISARKATKKEQEIYEERLRF